jgi:hypothetical protein
VLAIFDFGKNLPIAMPQNQINFASGASPSPRNKPIALEP